MREFVNPKNHSEEQGYGPLVDVSCIFIVDNVYQKEIMTQDLLFSEGADLDGSWP